MEKEFICLLLANAMRERSMKVFVRAKVLTTIKEELFTLDIGKMMRKMVRGDYTTLFKVYLILAASRITFIMDMDASSIKMDLYSLAIFEWEENTDRVRSKIINRTQLSEQFGRMVKSLARLRYIL